MKKWKKSWLILACILLSILNKAECYAQEVKETTEPGNLYAQSAVLMDGSSGRVLYEKNGEAFMANASTTKILTCILALENAELTDIVQVSSYAASMPDVQLHIREGEQYYLGDLLYSLMLESHNDVAVAIAEHISGSQVEFSKLMNKKAKEIGCRNTFFLTPNGLDAIQKIKKDDYDSLIQENDEGIKSSKEITEENIEARNFGTMEMSHGTTATDLALIMRYCIKVSPKSEQFLQITRTPVHSFQNVERTRSFSCHNHNAFLNMMEGALSGKTGFTGKAGYCYVGALEREGKCYIVALLACGWPNNKTYKWSDCRKLMEYGLEEYRLFSLEELRNEYENQLIAEVEQAKREKIDQKAEVELERVRNQIGEVLLESNEEIRVEVSVNRLEAPVKKGQPAGKITYYIEDIKWQEEMLVYKEDVEKTDFKWSFKMIINKMFH